MTKPSPFECLSIFTFSIMLSGCELAPNTAEEAKITPVRPAHWIDNQLSKQQINSLAMNSTEFKDDIQINSEK